MYTGYFAKAKEYREAGLIPVSIALMIPPWFDGPEYKKLAPSYDIFMEWKCGSAVPVAGTHKGDNEWYTKRFSEEILKKLDINEVKADLEKFGPLDKIVLCCYETPLVFCHRHLVAAWLNANSVKCLEYTVPFEPKSQLEEFML